MRKYLILIALLTVALSACRVESIVTLDIEEDGSALVGAEIGYDEEFAQLLGDAGADPGELFADLPNFGGDDIVQTERTEGDMTFVGVASRIDDLSQFSATEAAGEIFNSFSYEFDDRTATLSATITAETLGDASGDLPIDPSDLTEDFFRALVVVTMPGTVTESNADEVRADGALVWNLPITGGDVQIQATSDLGGSGASNLLIILVAAFIIVAIIAIIAATIMNRRRSQDAVAAAAAAHEATETAELETVPEAAESSETPAEPAEPDAAADTDEPDATETTLVDVEVEVVEDPDTGATEDQADKT